MKSLILHLGFARVTRRVLWLTVLLIFTGCAGNDLNNSNDNSTTVLPSLGEKNYGDDAQNSSPENSSSILTLDRVIEQALKSSPELEQVLSRIEAATEQVRQSESLFYPRLVLSESYGITNNPGQAFMFILNQRRFTQGMNFNNPGTQQNFGTAIEGQLSIFEGGSQWYNREAAKGMRRAVEAELMAARIQLITSVTETYYKWLQAISFIGVAERIVESAKVDEQLADARLRVEMALPSEIARLKARTAEVRSNLVVARTNTRRLQAALERLLARPIRQEEVPEPAAVASSTGGNPSPADSDLLIKQALARRPEMENVRALVLAAVDRVKSTYGGLFPKVNANARYEWDSESLEMSAESWFFGIQASWPFFEGGATLSKIREARAHLKEIQERKNQVSLDIALEVQQAALAVHESTEKIQVAKERIEWAQKALEEVRNLYRNQAATVDSLLQAEVAWDQSEVSYTSAIFEEKIAQAMLRKALGDFAESFEPGPER